jgi:hypothetical protein
MDAALPSVLEHLCRIDLFSPVQVKVLRKQSMSSIVIGYLLLF